MPVATSVSVTLERIRLLLSLVKLSPLISSGETVISTVSPGATGFTNWVTNRRAPPSFPTADMASIIIRSVEEVM